MSHDICGAEAKSTGEPCQRPAGWGTDNSSGRCKFHGGASSGAPKGNTNSVSHGLYAQENNFYQNVIGDNLRALCDEIFQDYATQYRETYGDIPTGHQARLFQIAVNQVKVIYSDNWLESKPDDLDSGHPLVDQETKYTEDGKPYHEYKESVLIGTQQKLRREDRQWLKDLGLLEDPESQKAEATESLAVVLSDDS